MGYGVTQTPRRVQTQRHTPTTSVLQVMALAGLRVLRQVCINSLFAFPLVRVTVAYRFGRAWDIVFKSFLPLDWCEWH